MRTIKIEVDVDTIVNAITADSYHCMIADSIQAQVPSAKFIQVDIQSIRFSDKERGIRYIYLTPPIAQQRILEFDKGKKVAPFEFTLSQGHERPIRKDRSNEIQTHRNKPRKKRGTSQHKVKKVREFGLRMFTDAVKKGSK